MGAGTGQRLIRHDPTGRVVSIRVLYRDPLVEFSEFRCRPDSVMWSIDNDIGDRAHAVVAGPAVRIVPDRGPALVADPTVAVRYLPDQHYRRELLDERGDHSLFVAAEPSYLDQLLGAVDSTQAVPVASTGWLAVRALARRLPHSGAPSALAVHEALARELRPTLRSRGGSMARRPDTRRAHERLAADAAAVLASDLRATLGLPDVARHVGAGVAHLARVFPSVTGLTMHGYRTRVRLLGAVDRLADGDDSIARVAHDYGFASHAHFTGACRSLLGAPPQVLRRQFAADARRQLRTMMEALGSCSRPV